MLKKLRFIFFVILSISAFGQKPMVQLIVEPKSAKVGEEITVTVKTNLDGRITIDFPEAFVKGNSEMERFVQESDFNTGQIISFHYLSKTGSVKKEGDYTFGPAYIRKGNKVYKSNIVSVKIEKDRPVQIDGDITMKQFRQPAFGIIEKSKKKIYQGEPVLLEAKIYSRFVPTDIDEYQTYTMDGLVEKHVVKNPNENSVHQEIIKGQELFIIEYDRQVAFPSEVGKITIKPFRLNLIQGFEGYSFVSSGSTIEVLALPENAPKDFTGGVGRFTLKSTINNNTIKQGEFVEMKVTVSGVGNLHLLELPKFNLPKGIVFYDKPSIKENFEFNENGSEGSITYIYNIQIEKSGKRKIPNFSFSYFDPIKEKYISLSSDNIEINVLTDKNFVASNNIKSLGGAQEMLSPKSISDKKQFADHSLFDKELVWGIFGVPFLIVFLLFVARRKKKEQKEIENKISFSVLNEKVLTKLNDIESSYHNNQFSAIYSSIPKVYLYICSIYLDKDEGELISKQEMFELLNRLDVNTQIIDSTKEIIRICEESSYGLAINPTQNDQLIEQNRLNTLQLLNLLKVQN